MLRWVFFSNKLPQSWEWWAVRETLIYVSVFTLVAAFIVLYLMPHDSSVDAKGNLLLVLFLLLWAHFRFRLKYGVATSFGFAWGVGLAASSMIIPIEFWGNLGLALIGCAVAVRAYSVGPTPARSQI